MSSNMLDANFGFLAGPADKVAQRLLGCYLVRQLPRGPGGAPGAEPGTEPSLGHRLIGRIVETEAYDQLDAASHSYKGRTPRTDVMFGPPGRLYVYFTYGMHYCCNIVTGPDGYGSAVLLRAVEPLEGQTVMAENRRGRRAGGTAGPGLSQERQLTNGPAKLCQAFQIDKTMNGHNLRHEPLTLRLQPAVSKNDIIQTTRVGISRATDVAWRFYIKGNPYVSNPR